MMPGVVRRIDCSAGGRPRSSRRSMRPATAEAGDGLTGARIERVDEVVLAR